MSELPYKEVCDTRPALQSGERLAMRDEGFYAGISFVCAHAGVYKRGQQTRMFRLSTVEQHSDASILGKETHLARALPPRKNIKMPTTQEARHSKNRANTEDNTLNPSPPQGKNKKLIPSSYLGPKKTRLKFYSGSIDTLH